MIHLDRCFKCFDLKYAAILIGTCYLTGEVSSIIALVLWYINSADYAYTNFSKNPLKVVDNPWILIMPVLTCVCAIVITILMIYGSLMNKFKVMIPFLLLNSVAIVFGFLISWAYIIFSFMEEGAKSCIWLFVLNGSIILSVYFWIVIYNRLEEIIIENGLYEKQIVENTHPKHPEQNLQSWAIRRNSTRIKANDRHSALESSESFEEPFRKSTN
ncbi:uncharacterized protein [Chelonus insularis]|uniref:uncharacterized protein n=1 Tax=Chelonus insularis TaxID=460826 RepID=UPI00158A061A|nr:uncharacterized protein LOC118066224 [Chelonus insularis]